MSNVGEGTHLVRLEEFDGSGDVKLAGHQELDSRGLGDETGTMRLFLEPHLTQELLHRLGETNTRERQVKTDKQRRGRQTSQCKAAEDNRLYVGQEGGGDGITITKMIRG